MTIYLGRIDVAQTNYSWLAPFATQKNNKYSWDQNLVPSDFPDRGTVHFSKGYHDGAYDHTVWVFEIQLNTRYEPGSGSAKFAAINPRPAYYIVNLPTISDHFDLRTELTLGLSIPHVAAASHVHWLFKTANGKAVYFSPNQLGFENRPDGRLGLKLDQDAVNNIFEVEVYDLNDLNLDELQSNYIDSNWLPVNKERYCWESDVRFMERMVNRLPKLKRRCQQLGMTLNSAQEISKAKAKDALEILEVVCSSSASQDLDRAMLERLQHILKRLDKNQPLLDKLFSLVYDNEMLQERQREAVAQHIKTRESEFDEILADRRELLVKEQSKLDEIIGKRETLLDKLDEEQKQLEQHQLHAKKTLKEQKESFETELARFKEDLELQAKNIWEQFSSKFAESLLQNHLAQIIVGTSSSPSVSTSHHAPGSKPLKQEGGNEIVKGVNDRTEWKKLIRKCSEVHCISEESLLLADVICRSREIPMLCGPSNSWVASCYASLFGNDQIIRFTPGPTALGLDDLFYRGGSYAPTQLQLFIDKAREKSSLVHLVMLEQIYAEQSHFWLPSLAREIRLGTRIPENVIFLISSSSDFGSMEAPSKEAIWKIDCKQISVSDSGVVVEPKKRSDVSDGLDSRMIAPGNPYTLLTFEHFIPLQNQLRHSHGNNPEAWSRFTRLMSTAREVDLESFNLVGQHLIHHLKK